VLSVPVHHKSASPLGQDCTYRSSSGSVQLCRVCRLSSSLRNEFGVIPFPFPLVDARVIPQNSTVVLRDISGVCLARAVAAVAVLMAARSAAAALETSWRRSMTSCACWFDRVI
jgi:hypothetical protein